MELTDVARWRLVSQGLIEPLPDAAAAVRHLVCTQAQDHPGAMTSLALRTRTRSLAGVRSAYDDGLIVRSWPLRGTLFTTAAEDLDWIRALTADKLWRASQRRRDELGLGPAELAASERLALDAVGERGATRAELLAVWTASGLAVEGGRGYHLLSDLALRGVLCQGPMASDREQRFVRTDTWITAPRRPDADAAIRELVLRYVTARGPVPIEDFAWWCKLGLTASRAAVRELADAGALASVDVDGVAYWMPPDLPDRAAALRDALDAPLLLPGFDEMVLGYGNRRAILTREEEALVVPGGNGVFRATVVHRGHAVGTWKRPTRTGEPVQVAPFGRLPAAVTRALPALTEALPR